MKTLCAMGSNLQSAVPLNIVLVSNDRKIFHPSHTVPQPIIYIHAMSVNSLLATWNRSHDIAKKQTEAGVMPSSGLARS